MQFVAAFKIPDANDGADGNQATAVGRDMNCRRPAARERPFFVVAGEVPNANIVVIGNGQVFAIR